MLAMMYEFFTFSRMVCVVKTILSRHDSLQLAVTMAAERLVEGVVGGHVILSINLKHCSSKGHHFWGRLSAVLFLFSSLKL